MKLEKVPKLRVDASDEVLLSAATIHAKNQFAKRVKDFLAGPRPEEYNSDMTWRLIERIDPAHGSVTYHFYGGYEVTVGADVYTTPGAGFTGRKSGRVEKNDQEGLSVSEF